ncbi:MAG TPA: nucleoside hydrolase [Planctomycetaceae bacterium]|nr:nucleoside hydrolase [Planctomycetaceae bacterium]
MQKQPLVTSFVVQFALLLVVAGWASPVVADERPPLILDADTANEIDDMYAIARMLNQDKFEVVALTSAQWIHYLAEDNSVGASQQINEDLVKLLGATLPTPIGSVEPMGKPWGGFEPKDSPAARAIIAAADKASIAQKLTVVCLGASTNLASAIALKPDIAPNIDAYLLGFRYDLEKNIWNKSSFNVRRDLNAADYLLNCSELQLSIMPANVARALTFKREDTFARHKRMGELGKYLTDKWNARFAEFDTWVMWDLALVQAIIDPKLAKRRVVATPPENESRKVTLYESIDAPSMRSNYWKIIQARYAN